MPGIDVGQALVDQTTAQELLKLIHSIADPCEDIIAKAKLDATALIARHEEAAQEKIASAERAALAEVRAKVADAATRAAAAIIAERHGAKADKALVDTTIAGLGRLN